ncbi:acyl-CoA dehydrogenase family protein [Jatrophihabitans fulvus]
MGFDFSVDPDFQELLDWTREFVRTNVYPLDVLWPHENYAPLDPERKAVVDHLKQQVRDKGLWACHLGVELGGQGFGQLKLALLNEILGTSVWAPRVFGTQAPDTGNAEIIAHFGTPDQKERYLAPLLEGDIVSCYSMTEPQGGADPDVFETTAVQDGDDWVITGQKFYSSNARWASFLIVMAVTDPEKPLLERMTMFMVEADAPGVVIERNLSHVTEPAGDGSEALISYNDVRVPASAILGGRGQAFVVAQTRLGGGRVHHAMRSIGGAQRCLDAMAERALSRSTKGERLSEKQLVQQMIAESYIDIQQFRLLVLYTAWQIDRYNDYKRVRKDIAAIKVMTPRVLEGVARRAIQIHGALGASHEMPFLYFHGHGMTLALADGPTEVHQVTVAKQVLRGYEPYEGLWPREYLPDRLRAAEHWLNEQQALVQT